MGKIVLIATLVLWGQSSLAGQPGCYDQKRLSVPLPYPYQYQSIVAEHRKQLRTIPAAMDVLLLGDSHAHLWPAEFFRPLQVVNTGIRGDLIEHVLWRLYDPEWQRVSPSNVILFIGSNNLARGDCAFAIIDGLNALISRMRSLWPNARIFVVGIPPRGEHGSLRSAERMTINQILKMHAGDENTIWVSADELLADLQPDHVHYLAEGYRVLTSTLRPKLK